MSASKVKKIKTQLPFTATWVADVLTITTQSNHNLITGDVVKIIPASGAADIITNAIVTVTSPIEFTILTENPYSYLKGLVEIDFFRSSEIDRQIVTMNRSVGASAVIHSFITGIGGATYNVEVSLDGNHWIPLTTITHLSNDSNFTTIEPNWAYLGISITSIGANTKLEILYSA